MSWENDTEEAYVTVMPGAFNPEMPPLQQVTTKIPPGFDGRTSWFAYEEAIDDWCDITELMTNAVRP